MQSMYDKIHFYKISQKEKEKILAILRKSLAKEKSIRFAIVFGSLTTREYIRDIDVCVFSSPKLSFRELLDLNTKIELKTGMPVDIVELENLTPTLREYVLKNGMVIKGKNIISKLRSSPNKP